MRTITNIYITLFAFILMPMLANSQCDDCHGQVLFDTPLSGDGRSYDLDMSAYSHGVYFIIITSSTGKKGQQKLIKL